jgi:hypothetical protein
MANNGDKVNEVMLAERLQLKFEIDVISAN